MPGEMTNGKVRGDQSKSFGEKKLYIKNESVDNIDEEDDEELDLSCGFGKFRTNVFGRKFANLYIFALCAGLSALFTTMIHQIMHIQLTSLQRQFNIDNAKAGLFDTSGRIGFLVTILFAGHFAKKVNIPMTVGLAGVLQGLVLTVPGILQLIDPYELKVIPPAKHTNSSNDSLGESQPYLCDSLFSTSDDPDNGTDTDKDEKPNQLAFIVILLVQTIKGISDAFHSGFLTTLYIDDNVLDKSKMGIYMGIKYVMHDIASPVGKEINGFLSEVPVDLKETEMDSKDRRFISAWWLGFLIFGLGTAVFSLPVLMFPKKLVTTKQKMKALERAQLTFAGGHVDDDSVSSSEELEPENETRKPSIAVSNTDFGQMSKKNSLTSPVTDENGRRRSSLSPPVATQRKVSLDGEIAFNQPVRQKEKPRGRGVGLDIVKLLKDFPRAFLRVVKHPVFILILIDIAIVSIPRSGTSMFKSVYMNHEYNVPMSEVAMIEGITSAVGHIGGTLISSWLSTKARTKLGFMAIIFTTYFITMGASPLYIIFGCDNVPVYGAKGAFGIPVNSTDSCDCTLSKQLISCGDDGNNYLSPCYAGCTDVDGKLFTACTGLANGTVGDTVTPGLCATSCHGNFLIYVIVHGVAALVNSLAMIPRRLLILRIVDPQDRGFATSLFMFSHSVLAIPAPNLFGSLIDDTCLIWDGDYCSLYDRDKIRYLISGIDIGVHGCVLITYLLMIVIFTWETKKLKKGSKKPPGDEEIDVEVDEKPQVTRF